MSADLRIGLGLDTHRLEPGRPCQLGGIAIDAAVGPVGHSDADAVLHAACDAVLGAAGLDDLGSLFPDDDPANKDRDSKDFCRASLAQAQAKGFKVLSMDLVVECEQPKLKPHRAAMRASIARLFDLDADAVNIKGKTGEGLGPIGAGEAIRVSAVALLSR